MQGLEGSCTASQEQMVADVIPNLGDLVESAEKVDPVEDRGQEALVATSWRPRAGRRGKRVIVVAANAYSDLGDRDHDESAHR